MIHVLPSEFKKVTIRAKTELFPSGCAKTAMDLVVKEITYSRFKNANNLQRLWCEEDWEGMKDQRDHCDRKRETCEAMKMKHGSKVGKYMEEKDIMRGLPEMM